MVKKTIYILTNVFDRLIYIEVFLSKEEAIKQMQQSFFGVLEETKLTENDKDRYEMGKLGAWIHDYHDHEYDWSITEKEITI